MAAFPKGFQALRLTKQKGTVAIWRPKGFIEVFGTQQKDVRCLTNSHCYNRSKPLKISPCPEKGHGPPCGYARSVPRSGCPGWGSWAVAVPGPIAARGIGSYGPVHRQRR